MTTRALTAALLLLLGACGSGRQGGGGGEPDGPGSGSAPGQSGALLGVTGRDRAIHATQLIPNAGCLAHGPSGGPFAMLGGSYVLRNLGNVPFSFAITRDQNWIAHNAPASGTLTPHTSLTFRVTTVVASAPSAPGTVTGTIRIRNSVTSATEFTIPVTLNVLASGGSSGWTVLTPSPDTRNVYLSAAGNDANSGLSEQAPKRTFWAAAALLRNGFPDWLHVRRGDQFQGGIGNWSKSGRSAGEPMVLTAYGTSADRPVFLCGSEDGITVHGVSTIHDVAFVGLHLFADTHNGTNGAPFGISLLNPCVRVLFEDMRFERFFTGARFQSEGHRDLKVRRSLFLDSFTVNAGHSQGIYADGVNGLLIEECVIDHSGWRPSVPGAVADIYRHNIYIQAGTTNVVIRGNVIARGSSHGVQARSGGEIRNNLFLQNAINLLVGSDLAQNGAFTANVIGNVILDGRDISAGERRGWAADYQCLISGTIAYNVCAHQVTGGDPKGYNFDSWLGAGVNNVDFHHNVSYRWNAPLSLSGTRFANLVLRDNDLQEFNGSTLFANYDGVQIPGFASSGNRLHTTAPTNQWAFWNSQLMSLATWRATVGDPSSVATIVSYPRPNETIADYDRAQPHAGAGSLDSFLTEARRQTKTFWRDKFVGTNATAYFRSNFGIVIP